jgi:hypothetical protein
MDAVCKRLSIVRGLQYPTATDLPDAQQRHAELQRVMLLLYDRVSILAKESQTHPNNIYLNGALNRDTSAPLATTLLRAPPPPSEILFCHSDAPPDHPPPHHRGHHQQPPPSSSSVMMMMQMPPPHWQG